MELTVVEKDKYRVAIVTKDGESEVVNFFNKLDESYEAHANGLWAILKIVSVNGLQDLTAKVSKCINKKEKIYEFKKGKLRLFYFKGKDNLLVVCTTALVKKTKKVKASHVKKAISLQKQYLAALSQKNLILWEGGEDE